VVRHGQILRIVDQAGKQGVDFLCYHAANPEERYHAANTMKKARSILLTTGHVLYSDVARPMFTIVADTCGRHDTIGGCCSAPSNLLMYGVRDVPGRHGLRGRPVEGRGLRRPSGGDGRPRADLELPPGQQPLHGSQADADPRDDLGAGPPGRWTGLKRPVMCWVASS
jgi:Domain of unknown function (DUF1989)